ncbi:MAG: hypothetical protein WDA42_09065, partial [Candidatus Bathyarchaeia archaeon]
MVALLASVGALVNNLNSQASLLMKLGGAGNAYLVTSEGSSSLFDSEVPFSVVELLRGDSQVSSVVAQQVLQGSLVVDGGGLSVFVRGVDDVGLYLKNCRASINGSVSGENQVNVGVILARYAGVSRGDLLNFTVAGKMVQFRVSSVVQANQQVDTQIVMPLSSLQVLTQDSGVSHVEFSLKDSGRAGEVLGNLSGVLPVGVEVTSLQQVSVFAADVNSQTSVFVGVWSVAIYFVVAGASYLVVARVVSESWYDLFVLRTIGAKRLGTFGLILSYALMLCFLGGLLGFSLGLVGSQVGSTLLRWSFGNAFLAPFLEVGQ